MTNSINTNEAALLALQSLTAINSDLESTQTRISTGLEIASAADNGALFAIAEGLRGELGIRDSIGSQLNFGQSVTGVALAGAESLSDNLNIFAATLTDLGNGGLSTANADLLVTRLGDIVLDLSASINNSVFNGINLLGGTSSDATQSVTVVGNVDGTTIVVSAGLVASDSTLAFTQAGSADAVGGFTGFNSFLTTLSGAVASLRTAVDTGNVASAATALLAGLAGLSAGDTAGAAALFSDNDSSATGQLNALQQFQSAISVVLNNLGSIDTRLENQIEFNQALADATEVGLGALVDADLARESAELQALQIQQQLATSSLGIANAAPSILLGLF